MRKIEKKDKKNLGKKELSKVVGGGQYRSPSYQEGTPTNPGNLDPGSNFRYYTSYDSAGHRQLNVANLIGSKWVKWNWNDGNISKSLVDNNLGSGNYAVFKDAYVRAWGAGSWPGWA